MKTIQDLLREQKQTNERILTGAKPKAKPDAIAAPKPKTTRRRKQRAV